MTLEYRRISGDASELRAAGEGNTLSGYAAKFNSQSEDMGFREVIDPEAFDRTLKARNEVKAYVNHDSSMVIGSTRSGTLELSTDGTGLADVIHLPQTTYAADLREVVSRGDVSGQSFGFTVVRDEWSKDYSQRRLLEVRLHEVSVVSSPAYSQTTVIARSLMRLAHRTGMVDVDALADAFNALQAGAELNDDQTNVLLETIDRSRPKAAPEPDPTIPVDVLLAKLSLLEKDI
jgi:HK97 family phage prohead protease